MLCLIHSILHSILHIFHKNLLLRCLCVSLPRITVLEKLASVGERSDEACSTFPRQSVSVGFGHFVSRSKMARRKGTLVVTKKKSPPLVTKKKSSVKPSKNDNFIVCGKWKLKKPVYSCNLCPLTFDNQPDLDKHNKIHEPSMLSNVVYFYLDIFFLLQSHISVNDAKYQLLPTRSN